jgi:hypothetical protein
VVGSPNDIASLSGCMQLAERRAQAGDVGRARAPQRAFHFAPVDGPALR